MVASLDQIRAELNMIEYFSVANEPQRLVLVAQRLKATVQIDDAESSMSQTQPFVKKHAGFVGPAMLQRSQHSN
jgi:hypothetical protein